jgi:hypothetical protein
VKLWDLSKDPHGGMEVATHTKAVKCVKWLEHHGGLVVRLVILHVSSPYLFIFHIILLV